MGSASLERGAAVVATALIVAVAGIVALSGIGSPTTAVRTSAAQDEQDAIEPAPTTTTTVEETTTTTVAPTTTTIAPLPAFRDAADFVGFEFAGYDLATVTGFVDMGQLWFGVSEPAQYVVWNLGAPDGSSLLLFTQMLGAPDAPTWRVVDSLEATLPNAYLVGHYSCVVDGASDPFLVGLRQYTPEIDMPNPGPPNLAWRFDPATQKATGIDSQTVSCTMESCGA